MSIGQLISQGFSFSWPAGQLPCLIPPDVPCTLKYDVNECIQAHRIDHHVPIFRFSTEFSYGMPAHSSSRGGIPGDNDQDDQERNAVLEEAAESRKEGEEDEEEWVDDISTDHLLTHLPKSRLCETCVQCKLYKYPSRRAANQREVLQDARKAEEPKGFLERVAIDHIEAGRDVGFGKEQYSLCMVDKFSGLVGLHTSETKSADDVEEGLRKFCGKLKPGIVSVASDRAPAILAAIKNLGFIADPAEPRSKIHNALAESTIRTAKGITACALLHSGMKTEYWPLVHEYLEYAMNITDHPNSSHSPKTPFEVAHGYPYEGIIAPFGCLMWYKDINPSAFEPKGKPGLFLGAEIIAGQKFKGIYKVWPLNAVSEGVFNSVVTRTVAIPPGKWRFPMRNQGQEPIGLKPKSIHSYIPPEKGYIEDDPALFDDEKTEDMGKPVSSIFPPGESVRKTPRNRAITRARIDTFGKTKGCSGCSEGTYSHTPACRERFNTLLEDEAVRGRSKPKAGDVGKPSSSATLDPADDGSFALHVLTGENLKRASTNLESGNAVVASVLVNALENGDGDEEDLSRMLAGILGKPVNAGKTKKSSRKEWFVEYCCSTNSSCCQVAAAHSIPYIGLSLSFGDLTEKGVQEQVHLWFKERVACGESIHLWGSISCGPWSPLQNLNIAVQGQVFEFKLQTKRAIALGLVQFFRVLADEAMESGGTVSFEWPKCCKGWIEPQVLEFISSFPFFFVIPHRLWFQVGD